VKRPALGMISVIGVGLFLTGCTPSSPNWNYNLKLSWHGENYMVTKSYLTKPGKNIGMIRYFGHGSEIDLYSVNGATENQAICINSGNGYLLALGIGKSSFIGP